MVPLYSWYAELGTRFPFCIAQNAKWTDSENNKQGFALDVIFQNETVCKEKRSPFFTWSVKCLFFRELWKNRFIFRETWSRPPLYNNPRQIASSYFHSASQSCPILSANCSIIYVCFVYFAAIAQVWINLHRQNVFYTVLLWKGSKVPQELGGRRRSKHEKDNQGVGGFRFTNILKLFSICFFFSITLLYHFFSRLFLPTTFTHTHTHDPYPLPTTHDI